MSIPLSRWDLLNHVTIEGSLLEMYEYTLVLLYDGVPKLMAMIICFLTCYLIVFV